MSNDPTETIRRAMVALSNIDACPLRTEAEKLWGQVWDTEELTRDFEVLGFSAPVVVVVRKSDGKKGSLQFQARPRFYHSWGAA